MATGTRISQARWMLLRSVFVCVLGFHQAWGQSPVLQDVIGGVNPDTLLTTLRLLTGETGTTNGGTGDTILSRWYSMPSHTLATTFLERRLSALGLQVTRTSFLDTLRSITGTNILGEQRGVRFPLIKYILCAHYDATAGDTQNSVAPGADDNATGTAAVLEAARLLTKYQTDYTVLYALWDCEEAGARGSAAYAKAARARGDSILGVVNLDMLGTDINNDSLVYVAGGSTRELADTVAQLCQLYLIGIKPVLVFPGNQSSDHASFGRQKYRAIMLIEDFADYSPVNHTSGDRIAKLNLAYYYRYTQLAVATLAFLAGVSPPSAVEVRRSLPGAFSLSQNFPNPFNPTTTIRYALPRASHVTLTVYDALGRHVAELVNGNIEAGCHEVALDARHLASGVYFYRLQAAAFTQVRAMALVR